MSDKVDEKKKIKLTLKNMRVVAKWKYTAENENCQLCHRDLMKPVQEPNSNLGNNKLNGDVTIGTCQHGFHTVCINSWIYQGNISCPHCQTIWKATKNVGSSVYVYKTTNKE
jgi:hypothetical protein